MLLFVKGHYLPLIARGEKTLELRPWRTCTLQPGGDLSFNGKLRVRITAVTRVRLAALSVADLAAASFSSRAACVAALQAHYPARAITDASEVWVIRFSPPQ